MKRRYSWPLWTLAGLVLLLVALHLALPYVVRDYLNERLANMGDYRGQITDVDLALWRGAYKNQWTEKSSRSTGRFRCLSSTRH